ncbi:hypothetical protein L210DRAFT_1013846, partial [Boletus edulis BED1]
MSGADIRTRQSSARLRCHRRVGQRGSHERRIYVSNAGVAEPSDFVISEEGKPMQDDLWVSV